MTRSLSLFLALSLGLRTYPLQAEIRTSGPVPNRAAFIATETLSPTLLQRFQTSFQTKTSALILRKVSGGVLDYEMMDKIYLELGNDAADILKMYNAEYLTQGSFGRILRGRHPENKGSVLIKVTVSSDRGKTHFDNEVRVLRSFKDSLFAASQKEYPFPKLQETYKNRMLITDFFEGQTLGSYLWRKAKPGNVFSMTERLEIMLGILDAVAFQHALGWAHLDLSRVNILLREEAGHFFIRLTDFGSAHRFGGWIESPAFTRPYAAPELQNLDFLKAVPAIDIYALGVILYEVMTQSFKLSRNRIIADISMILRPFHKILAENQTLDIRIRDVIRKATQINDRARFPSVSAMRTALQQAV